MYYHEIKTILRLHEFDIHERLLKCKMTKVVITRIQYTFQWDFPSKTKVAKGDPYINSDCDENFWAIICHQKATLQAIPEYLSEFRVFCATLISMHLTNSLLVAVKVGMKRKARDLQDSSHHIVGEGLETVTEGTAAKLPKLDSLNTYIYSVSKRAACHSGAAHSTGRVQANF